MGKLLKHLPTHDLYLYGDTYYIDPTNYTNNKTAFPVQYNPTCWIKDPQYNLPNVDFSGITIRGRGAPAVSFSSLIDEAGLQNVNASGVLVGWTGSGLPGAYALRRDPLTGITYLYPYALNSLIKSFTLGGTGSLTQLFGNVDLELANTSYYFPGRPVNNFELASDWKNWNCGYPCGILISPRHVITTAHFINPFNPNATFTFLGKNNVKYSKAATLVYFSGSQAGPPQQPPGYDLGIGPDVAIYQLNEKFTTEELEQVKVYKLFDSGSLDKYSAFVKSGYGTYSNEKIPVFYLWNQGFVTVSDVLLDKTYFNLDQYPDAPNIGGTLYNDGIPGVNPLMAETTSGITFTCSTPGPLGGVVLDASLSVWIGDSGTPTLIYVPSINETCLVEMYRGAGGYVGSKWFLNDPVPGSYSFAKLREKFWIDLKKYIFENTDPNYNIEFVEYAGRSRQRPPYNNVLIIDGITYYAAFERPSRSGTGPVSIIANLTPGSTYSFAVVTRGKGGIISTPTTLTDVYLPGSNKYTSIPNAM